MFIYNYTIGMYVSSCAVWCYRANTSKGDVETSRASARDAESSRAEPAFANARFAFDVQYMYLHRFDVGALSVSSSSTSLLVSARMSRSKAPLAVPTNISRSSAMRCSM